MEHFLGLHYTENTIENGMKRLSVIKTPFNKTNIDRINRQMLKMSGQRDTLKNVGTVHLQSMTKWILWMRQK